MINPDDIHYVAGCNAVHPDHRGGQHVAKYCSGVFAIHRPTGIGAMCNMERSQLANKHKATEMLQALVELYAS